MSNPKERRHYPRPKVKLPVVKMVGNDLVDGEIEDLSLGGRIHPLLDDAEW